MRLLDIIRLLPLSLPLAVATSGSDEEGSANMSNECDGIETEKPYGLVDMLREKLEDFERLVRTMGEAFPPTEPISQDTLFPGLDPVPEVEMPTNSLAIIIDVILCAEDRRDTARALINSAGEYNYISGEVLLRPDWSFKFGRSGENTVFLFDLEYNGIMLQDVPFLLEDEPLLKNTDMSLGMPWLQAANPQIDWKARSVLVSKERTAC